MLCVLVFVGYIVSVINAQGSCGGSNCPSYSECQKYTRYTLALQNWQNGTHIYTCILLDIY